MGALLNRLARATWSRLPISVRSLPALGVVRQKLRRALGTNRSGAELYDRAYYRQIDRDAGASLERIAADVASTFRPSTVIDVGCGSGALLQALQSRGVRGVGLERSGAALKLCRKRGVEVFPFDLERQVPPPVSTFDVATSLEVAEHLQPSAARQFVELLCALAPVVVMTAATPGQGGLDHVNEQPNRYWIERFLEHGYGLDRTETERFRRRWQEANLAPWYAQNVMVFRNLPS